MRSAATNSFRLPIVFLALAFLLTFNPAAAQDAGFRAVRASVDFGTSLRVWDGFGVNYVETAQTFDYGENPQDYGGFRFLNQADREEIIDMVFGNEGLRPAIVKMFLDPLHQHEQGGPYDHTTTTASMRFFVREGLRHMRRRGDSLSIITTMYGPPGYITKQRVIRGRDLDPARENDLVAYLVDWARYLQMVEHFPIRHISLNNEGEDWVRWPADGALGETEKDGHDYNFYMQPEMVARMLVRVRAGLDDAGLPSVGVTNGEPTNWYRLPAWGYADAIAKNEQALRSLGLVTSHGFYVGEPSNRWYAPHTPRGVDMLRAKRPELHAWSTSSAWDEKEDSLGVRQYVMDAGFIKEVHGNIYEVGVNGFIPWACLQNASQWNKPDPNPGSAFRVYDDGSWDVEKGYYYYRQVSSVGQPGMSIAPTTAMEGDVALIGFGANGTRNPDAIVAINFGTDDKDVVIHVAGTQANEFSVRRTSGRQVYKPAATARKSPPQGENYRDLGHVALADGAIRYSLPANSVTTFTAR